MPTTVTKVTQIGEDQSWRWSDNDNSTRLPVRFLVELSADDLANGRTLAKTASANGVSVPAMGAQLGTTGLYVREIEAQFHGGAVGKISLRLLLVTAWYAKPDPISGTSGGGTITEAPWDRDREVDLDSSFELVESQYDLAGHKFVNSAGAPYSAAISIPKSSTVITLRDAVLRSAFNPFDAGYLVGTFNNDSVTLDDGVNQWIIGAGQLQLMAVRCRLGLYNGTKYYSRDVVMARKVRHVDESGAPYDNYLLRIISMGTSQAKTGGTPGVDFEPIREEDPATKEKIPVTSPRYLDTNGQACDQAAAAVAEYTVGELADWSTLF